MNTTTTTALHVSDYLNIEDLPRECIDDCSAPGQDASEAVMWCGCSK